MSISPADIEKMPSADVDEIIRGYFSEDEWRDLPENEKLRNRLMFVNYVSHPEVAHLTPVPPFLLNSKGELLVKELAELNPNKQKTRGRKRKSNKTNTKDTTPQKTNRNCSEIVRRNPERDSKMKILNYEEKDIPADDRYIFCDRCQKEVLDYCDTCGTLVVVKDVRVPVGVPDRARKTLPPIFEIRESKLHGLGVFVQLKLPQGIQLGPYEGTVTRISNTNGYSWKLRNGKLVDAANETVSNWMRYVNCAPHISAQNLVAFQYKGELFYRTVRTIQKGEELLVYYGNSFARELGIEPKKYFDPQIEYELKEYYTCKYCHIGLSMQKFLDVHEKYCYFRDRVVYYTGETFPCAHCKVLCTSYKDRDAHQIRCRKKPNLQRKGEVAKVGATYACEKCNYQSNKKGNYRSHLIVHDKENAPKYKCSKCSFTTIRKDNLKKHLRLHSAFGFVCQCCAKSFKQKGQLDNHYVSRHPEKLDTWKDIITKNNIKECSQCGYKTVRTSDFKTHILRHSNSMKYHCAICGYKSIYKSSFTVHLRIHVDYYPFVCTECKKKFNRKHQLDNHILFHHRSNDQLMKSISNKIHCCSTCEYKTIRSFDLKRHQKKCNKI